MLFRSGYKVSAGLGYFLFDDVEEGSINVVYNNTTRKADLCIGVDGYSMQPLYDDGDLLLVRRQPSIEAGEIGIFIKGSQAYVKKMGSDRLISLNRDYDDIYPSEYENIECYGKVIDKLHDDWRR